ncbi:hypothetical protein ABBQ38_006650 [Trebouxia sp. C0009 RCD-2024]
MRGPPPHGCGLRSRQTSLHSRLPQASTGTVSARCRQQKFEDEKRHEILQSSLLDLCSLEDELSKGVLKPQPLRRDILLGSKKALLPTKSKKQFREIDLRDVTLSKRKFVVEQALKSKDADASNFYANLKRQLLISRVWKSGSKTFQLVLRLQWEPWEN